MALSTRRLCVLLLLLLGLAATFSHVAGAVLQDDSAATFPAVRRAGPPVAGAYHRSGFSHVPHGYYGSKQISFGVGDYDSAGGRGSVWNVGAVMVAPVLAAAWFA